MCIIAFHTVSDLALLYDLSIWQNLRSSRKDLSSSFTRSLSVRHDGEGVGIHHIRMNINGNDHALPQHFHSEESVN